MLATLLIIFLAAFISERIRKYIRTSETPKQKLLNQLALVCLMFLVMLSIFTNHINLKGEGKHFRGLQEYCKKNHLPQNDSTMLFAGVSIDKDDYYSCSRDSIRHSFRTIEYDLMGIKKVTDYFYNEKSNQSLSQEFSAGGWFRNSSNVYRIVSSGSQRNEQTISKQEFDKYIQEWGLADRVYKEYKLRN